MNILTFVIIFKAHKYKETLLTAAVTFNEMQNMLHNDFGR